MSPLVANVSKLTATAAFRSSGTAINGGTVVAKWGGGKPLIVRGVKNNRNIVELNFYPPSSKIRNDFWVGDGFQIIRNALYFK